MGSDPWPLVGPCEARRNTCHRCRLGLHLLPDQAIPRQKPLAQARPGRPRPRSSPSGYHKRLRCCAACPHIRCAPFVPFRPWINVKEVVHQFYCGLLRPAKEQRSLVVDKQVPRLDLKRNRCAMNLYNCRRSEGQQGEQFQIAKFAAQFAAQQSIRRLRTSWSPTFLLERGTVPLSWRR